jgi:hypothetical protein
LNTATVLHAVDLKVWPFVFLFVLNWYRSIFLVSCNVDIKLNTAQQ